MNIIHKSIYIINYETQQVILREPPATFDSYVAELINHISNNTSVREYKTHSDSTEVISCILRQHRTIAEASAVESPIRQETIGFPAHFFARAHNFKPPGRACQPEADSPMRT